MADCADELACAGSRDVYGCAGDGERPCVTDIECVPGEACVLARTDSVCVPYCFDEDDDCPAGQSCQALGIVADGEFVEDAFYACLPA